MKIVILDGYSSNPGDLSWQGLEAFGELKVYDDTKNEDTIERIGDAEIVILNKTPIIRRVINECKNIRYIGILATGYNVVDLEAAKENGIVVCNVPSYSTAAVAQLTIAHLLEICHHVGHHSKTIHEKDWNKNIKWCYWDYPLIELAGKTMGIIGFGEIGQQTANIAISMGMKILANSRNPQKNLETPNIKYVTLDQLLHASDVISLHCPINIDSEGIINKWSIAKMKDGVILLNMSRGGLIIEKDLKVALTSGKIYMAGIDVVAEEPMKSNNVLLGMDNVLITPHFGWGPKESRTRLIETTVLNVKNFIDGTPTNVVNP